MSDVNVTPISPGDPGQGGIVGRGHRGSGRYASLQPPPSAGGRGCLGIWAFLATLGLGLSLLLNFGLLSAKAVDPNAGPSSLHERLVEGEGTDKIALLEIEGVIADKVAGGGLFGAPPGEGLVKRIKDQLDRAKADNDVKAVILRVDSPGGTITASDQLHHYLAKFREESSKPLVVHQGALAASGGYYVSAPADEIICETTTITGSIGVILGGMPNVSKFLKEHGIEDMTVTSGPNKDLLSPTGPVRDSHKKIIQATVDDMYERFVWVVAEGIARRDGASRQTASKEAIDAILPKVKELADGRIYTAKQALDLKLVSSIGYWEDTVAAAKKRAGIAKARVIRYKKDPTLMDVLSGNVETKIEVGGVTVKIDAALLDELRTPRYLALWRGD